MPGFHAKRSPSGAKRRRYCPGSDPYVNSLPPELRSRSGEAAKKGTAAHFLLETSLRAGIPPDDYRDRIVIIAPDTVDGDEDADSRMLKAGAKLPKSPEERSRAYIVDQEILDNVHLAYDYITGRCEELGIPLAQLQLETRTNPVPDRDDTSGTADVTLDAWDTLEVVDYKNGRLTVEHEENDQLLRYLAGRAHDSGWSHDFYFVTVVQPNGRHEEGKVRRLPVTKERLLAFVDEARAVEERTDRAAAEFTGEPLDWLDPVVFDEYGAEATWASLYLAAGDHCTFCDAQPVCPTYKAWRKTMVAETLKEDFAEFVQKPILVLAAEDAQDFLKHRPALMAAFRAADRFLAEEARHGRMPAGMKFVRKRGKRIFGEDGAPTEEPAESIIERMVAAGYLSDNTRAKAFNPAELRTAPQVEELVPRKLRKDWNAEFVTMRPGGLKLVPVDAPGEAIVPTPADDFTLEDTEGDYLT
jgi:hypothetical protein